MNDTQTTVSEPILPPAEYEQMVRDLDRLLEEERRLDILAHLPDCLSGAQATADLAVNHAQTAALVIHLWRMHAGE